MFLLQYVSDIGLPSNDSCLNCHTKAGGGDNFKRGDIEEAHRLATEDFDVHLSDVANGGAGLRCLDCHVTQNHKIAGRWTDLPPTDLAQKVACDNCHSSAPPFRSKNQQDLIGWGYDGHTFAETEKLMGFFHEVAPKEQTLSCNDCHNGGTRIKLNFFANIKAP